MGDSLSQAVTAFGLDVYNKLNKSGACKNVFISPLSISAAMAMVVGGAMGSTKTQMEKVSIETNVPPGASYNDPFLCWHLSDIQATSEFKKLLLQLNNLSPAYQLNLANNLFIQAGHKFLQQYLTFTKETFGAMLQTVDFSNAVEEAREIINLEIERQTQGKRAIGELFAPGVIGPEAVLVLGNAVYFKATWEHQFDPNCTVERAFRLSKNASKPVHMMHQKGIFKLGYMRGTNARILCLPYVGEVLSMLIMLPKDIGDLEQVNQKQANFAHWTASENMEEDHVEVYIPRFKLEDSFDLNMTLQALGMIDVFDKSKANLSGMSPSHPLFLSNVLHKAFLEVNEEGTEAAAVAGAVISIRSLVTYDLFLVDHPFLFCIQHNPTNTVLFLGKLCSP
uniref:Serpin family B member 11 (gene/pseudogene) n=1 Tax=Varanus komodoensis TaxID=61221 RepID=A0A8D2L116_VARKO